MRTLKVVIADDHQLMLAAIRLVLDEASGIELVGETTRGTQVLPIVSRTQPDVVLLDFAMPDMDGLAVLGRLRKDFPKVDVVMFSGSDDPDLIAEALRMGASAFVLKAIDPGDLAGAIRQAVEGTVAHQIFGEPEERPASAGNGAGLSKRELSILTELCDGLSNKQIAKQLWLATSRISIGSSTCRPGRRRSTPPIDAACWRRRCSKRRGRPRAGSRRRRHRDGRAAKPGERRPAPAGLLLHGVLSHGRRDSDLPRPCERCNRAREARPRAQSAAPGRLGGRAST